MTSDLHEGIAEKAVDVVHVRGADPVRVSDQETLAMTKLVDKGLAKSASAANQMQGKNISIHQIYYAWKKYIN